MPQIRYVQPSGAAEIIDVPAGTSVMLAAIRNGVRGIEAECGGCLDCATCHVYLDEPTMAALPPPSDQEEALLAAVAAERRPTSRLGCQVIAPAGDVTLTVHVPERQL
ncbi:2Fe-2S iron-sulfur cluster binding domain-containing protein [Bradyrhizobium sp. U87765 SZCCT0131]|uniref:2Fe-2S iron-sulfur cluster-binding protein n=1 Tax=unclassified Bradyrhizobium TaxID=2631580 RepID=UPI001BAADC88|nr:MULTISPECIES: 2Fe-2S iron-sulfur cluster-binding protein [unclassified Bradyrhizobium]MBR1222773.1 2Fe-2S iron-sulfur cluster binding domain-containing protein [Bradyrhizobium sp. U87765 SZCCT0131]MBR1265146.1 2Fe-2S iron-sulfur cluster binding domain-containing protein [Bradyrhizobium sp. U87765 SZCCT0134]MBR1303075.1 2Fe-2S iron-sulfur cluster binding domain-containing protein [Bradyrhizobium sp. U87765 SZCCT0110]MBR1318681.1 2Fe-2S iron-sulfur cluster binding domain-containing protein [Br